MIAKIPINLFKYVLGVLKLKIKYHTTYIILSNIEFKYHAKTIYEPIYLYMFEQKRQFIH